MSSQIPASAWSQMVMLQEELNNLIGNNWRSQPWSRAIWMECAEMMDREGWKWWKDRPEKSHDHAVQQAIEIMDICHFVLSWAAVSAEKKSGPGTDAYIQRAGNMLEANWNEGVDAFMDRGISANDPSPEVRAIEFVADAALRNNLPLTISAMAYLAQIYGLTGNRVVRMYQEKNILNIFRQKNGYQSGGYIKNWPVGDDGQTLEDNEVLGFIMDELDESNVAAECRFILIRQRLQTTYQKFAA